MGGEGRGKEGENVPANVDIATYQTDFSGLPPTPPKKKTPPRHYTKKAATVACLAFGLVERGHGREEKGGRGGGKKGKSHLLQKLLALISAAAIAATGRTIALGNVWRQESVPSRGGEERGSTPASRSLGGSFHNYGRKKRGGEVL